MRNPVAEPLLVLIGFMGAGKSTLGRLLAEQLGCPYADLDQVIEKVHGPIPELFTTRGESGFRAIEYHQLDMLLPTLPHPSVLALGGGAFLQPANRELLELHAAKVIFLDAPFDVARARIAGTGHQRPLAADVERLRELYERRRPVYLLAEYRVSTDVDDPNFALSALVELSAQLGVTIPTRGTL